jgi:hypothetical protein
VLSTGRLTPGQRYEVKALHRTTPFTLYSLFTVLTIHCTPYTLHSLYTVLR